MQKRQRRLLICMLLVFMPSAGAFMFSMYEDPFAIHHSREYQPLGRPARAVLSSYSYVGKASDIIRYKPSELLLGSSIVDNGFRIYGSAARWYDPVPNKTKTILALINNNTTLYNAAVRGGGLYEALTYLRHAYVNNPNLNKVILGTEFSMFTSLLRIPATPEVSALGKTQIPFDFYMDYTLSSLALSSAWDIVSSKSSRVTGFTTTISSLFHDLIKPIASESEADASLIISRKYNLQQGSPSAEILRGSRPYEVEQFVFTVWFVNSIRKVYLDSGLTGLMHEKALETLGEIIAFCKDKHINIEIFRSPQPPVFWAMMRHFGMEQMVEYWLRQEAKIAPSWDFSGYIDFNNGERFFTTDSLHYNEKTGEVLLPVLYNTGDTKPEGVRLVNEDTVESIILWRKNLLDTWTSQHASINNSISAVPVDRIMKSEVTNSPSPTMLMPAEYSPDYKGYKIYKFMGLYYAIAATISQPYDFYKFIQKKYPDMQDADSLESIILAIDKQH